MTQELITQLETVITELAADVTKFDEKGNKAAGTRIRKAMQTVKGLAQDVRVAVSEANKA
jgi:anti-sigma regulatory factor (Ser/Thr protein kinase)|tara:strand:- start:116 stop:295 length:180 start_codon:yes stop_codon:yes gene_type:complete